MKTITVYDTEEKRIESISERYGLTEAEVIEIVLDYIYDSDVQEDLFR